MQSDINRICSGFSRISLLLLATVLALLVSMPAAAQSADRGRYGNFALGRYFGPDPQWATGIAGPGAGGRSASNVYGSHCAGQIDTSPDHQISISSAVNLNIRVSSDTDATLVLVSPSATFCDDDGAGNLDPMLNVYLVPGQYDVYVGRIGSLGSGEYTLTIRENL